METAETAGLETRRATLDPAGWGVSVATDPLGAAEETVATVLGADRAPWLGRVGLEEPVALAEPVTRLPQMSVQPGAVEMAATELAGGTASALVMAVTVEQAATGGLEMVPARVAAAATELSAGPVQTEARAALAVTVALVVTAQTLAAVAEAGTLDRAAQVLAADGVATEARPVEEATA